MILTKEVIFVVLSLAICGAGYLYLHFSKSDSEEGFTDMIGEGDTAYIGYTDKFRPDLINRPSDGTFWSAKYTPIWLSKEQKEESDKN